MSTQAVSRKSASTQRSMFAQPENSAQQAQAFVSQSSRGSAKQFIAQHGQRRQNRAQNAPQSFFGGNRVPGQTEVQQPNARMVRQSGAPQAGRQRRQMSLDQIGNFIARQNQRAGKGGGRRGVSCTGGLCAPGGSDTGYNFDRSLSSAGASMARKGAMPSELGQMAVPFQSSRRAAKNSARAAPAHSAPRRTRRQKDALGGAAQIGMVNDIKRVQQQQRDQQSAQRGEQAKTQAALSMGVPFKSRARTAAPAPHNIVKPKAVRLPPKVSRETAAHRFRPIDESALQSMHSSTAMRGSTMSQEQFLDDNEDSDKPPSPGLFDNHVQDIARKRAEMLQNSAPVLDDEPTQFPVSQQKRRNGSLSPPQQTPTEEATAQSTAEQPTDHENANESHGNKTP